MIKIKIQVPDKLCRERGQARGRGLRDELRRSGPPQLGARSAWVTERNIQCGRLSCHDR